MYIHTYIHTACKSMYLFWYKRHRMAKLTCSPSVIPKAAWALLLFITGDIQGQILILWLQLWGLIQKGQTARTAANHADTEFFLHLFFVDFFKSKKRSFTFTIFTEVNGKCRCFSLPSTGSTRRSTTREKSLKDMLHCNSVSKKNIKTVFQPGSNPADERRLALNSDNSYFKLIWLCS